MFAEMSSSSEDDYCSNTLKKFQCMKDKWVPDIKQPITTVDNINLDLSFDVDDEDAVKIVEPKSEKKRKNSKKTTGKKVPKTAAKKTSEVSDLCSTLETDQAISPRSTRSKSKKSQDAEGLMLITSYFTPDTAANKKPTSRSGRRRTRKKTPTSVQRQTTNRGRRSHARATGRRNYINLGCDSEDEGNIQPLFSTANAFKSGTLNESLASLENGGSFSEILDCSNEMDNEELSVKVHWRSKDFVTFKIRKHQKLTTVFEHFAKLVSEPVDHILLTLGDRLLRPQDTPALIQYNICQFIEGGVVPHSITNIAQESAIKHGATDKVETNDLKLKIQSKTMKSPIEVTIAKDQKMSVAMIKFSEEVEIPIGKLKFYFDGDPVDENSTPESLDIEGGECIDVNIVT